MADIALSGSIRSNLISLQKTTKLLGRTNTRLSTGKKVSSAIDNPTNFFAAQSYNDRASGLNGRLDGMGEAIQQVKAADNGISGIRGFLSQMKGVVNDALANSDSTARGELGKQFNELIVQANSLAKDSGYAGINLLNNNDERTVQFNENFGDSTLSLKGINVVAAASAGSDGELAAAVSTGDSVAQATSYALSINTSSGSSTGQVGIKSYGTDATGTGGHEVDWGSADYTTELTDVVQQIETMDETLKTTASKLANNLAVITQREDFTKEHVNILQEGADKLTLADLNEEGANLLSLQTASSLGINSLSLASQQSQNVLRLVQ
jgi:flagellin-like hook-associated protein FlgL